MALAFVNYGNEQHEYFNFIILCKTTHLKYLPPTKHGYILHTRKRDVFDNGSHMITFLTNTCYVLVIICHFRN